MQNGTKPTWKRTEKIAVVCQAMGFIGVGQGSWIRKPNERENIIAIWESWKKN